MGRNDNLIEDYRNIITNVLLDDPTIVEILGNGKIPLDEADILMDGSQPHITPHEYLPGIITETGSYIMYDMDEEALYPSQKNVKSYYSSVSLYFWVVTSRDMSKYKGKLRNDVLTRRLRQLFGEQDGLGIAKNHFVYNKIFDPQNHKYMGRVVKFVITDWSDKLRYQYDRKS